MTRTNADILGRPDLELPPDAAEGIVSPGGPAGAPTPSPSSPGKRLRDVLAEQEAVLTEIEQYESHIRSQGYDYAGREDLIKVMEFLGRR